MVTTRPMDAHSHVGQRDRLKLGWIELFCRWTPILALLWDDPNWDEALANKTAEVSDALLGPRDIRGEQCLDVRVTEAEVKVPAWLP